MMHKTVLVLFVFMSFLSCGKPKTYDNEFEYLSGLDEKTKNFLRREQLRERASFFGLWMVRLVNGTIIGKVKSSDGEYSENAMSEAYLGIDSEDDYDVIIIDTEDNSYKTILRDKYRNIKLLPILFNKTIDRDTITIHGITVTPFFKCFLLQTIKHTNTYKLLYLDNIDSSIDNIIQRDYEYESTFTPSDVEITITPHYFIVYHQGSYTVREADNYGGGAEYILIDKKTGEYSVIDSTRAVDIERKGGE